MVDITTINDDELAEILKNELKEIELSDFEEQVCQISGGIVLEENNIIYIEPTCCGDIGNVKGWEMIFESELDKWNQLWIGHPWVYYRKVENFIEFSNYTNSNPEDFKDNEILIRVFDLELGAELKKIREQQDELEFRIQKILEGMGLENAEQISKIITGVA